MKPDHIKTAAPYFALLTATLAVWTIVVSPLAAWRSDVFQDREVAIRELNRLNSNQNRLLQERQLLSGDLENDLIWDFPRSGAAVAQVQSAVSQIANQSGVQFKSISPTPNSTQQSGEFVSFRVEFEASLDQVSNFLRALEYHSPVLLVEQGTMRRIQRPGSKSTQPLIFAQLGISAPILGKDEPNE